MYNSKPPYSCCKVAHLVSLLIVGEKIPQLISHLIVDYFYPTYIPCLHVAFPSAKQRGGARTCSTAQGLVAAGDEGGPTKVGNLSIYLATMLQTWED